MPKSAACLLALLTVAAGLGLAETAAGNLRGVGLFIAIAGAAWLYGLATDDHVGRARAAHAPADLRHARYADLTWSQRVEKMRADRAERDAAHELARLGAEQKEIDDDTADALERSTNGGRS